MTFADLDLIRTRPVILVANKIDLARSRAVSSQGISTQFFQTKSFTVYMYICIFRVSSWVSLPFQWNTIVVSAQTWFMCKYVLNEKWNKRFLFFFHLFPDGKCLACTYRAKYIEVSVGINHNVDELLAGTLTQIRLKKEQNALQVSTFILLKFWIFNHYL